MNQIQWVGKCATEVSLRRVDGGLEPTFIIEIQDDDGGQMFRVRCRGRAAEAVEAEAQESLLRGRMVAVAGSLRRVVSDDCKSQGVSFVHIEATSIEFLDERRRPID
jgi:hypothetical protein